MKGWDGYPVSAWMNGADPASATPQFFVHTNTRSEALELAADLIREHGYDEAHVAVSEEQTIIMTLEFES